MEYYRLLIIYSTVWHILLYNTTMKLLLDIELLNDTPHLALNSKLQVSFVSSVQKIASKTQGVDCI